MTDLVTDGRRLLLPDGSEIPCSMGRSGLISADAKREGDGATPIGRWRLLSVYFRRDRLGEVRSILPTRALTQQDGWCDDPADSHYNQAVTLPYPASHEELWRADALYDLIVVTDHNTGPAIPGMGSAIFLHCRHPEGKPTEGCIAIETTQLRTVLAALTEPAFLDIRPTL